MAFNSREHEWADVSLRLGGVDITGIRGIKFTEKIEREVLYAKGRNPYAIQSGNISYEGEITILQSAYDLLLEAGGGTILSLSLIGIVHFRSNGQTKMKTSTIENLTFSEGTKETKQGDKFMEITLPFIATNITTI
jgi:hypothetical protein